ncbi:MAG: rRNA ((1402)-N(4))-methyltransferase RsmH [Bacteroidota bacterium]|jgi:16S rRNA (cytosine1402-N4)-methyltransferase|nr:16S rRNA (cytosine(1402)-N(4))-methyltransferase RsmH [Bacteroidia bacterium]
MYDYHDPVLLHPSVDALVTNPDGTYVDVTFGGGGHSRAILNKLSPKGKLIAFDQDEDTLQRVPSDPRFTLVNHNFQFTKPYLEYLKALPVDGILADLGISSHQIDVGERGFAHRLNGPLDMRMSAQNPTSAAHLVNTGSEADLLHIFKQYGEIPNARRLAEVICRSRGSKDLSTIEGFKAAIAPCTPGKTPAKYLSQVFQALRIAVNKEMFVLETLLQDAEHIIKPGGKLVVIAYHSLEDRLVKHLFQTGNLQGERHTDLYGHISKPFDSMPNAAIAPDAEEIERNKRARSAKMRIGVRNTWKRTHS